MVDAAERAGGGAAQVGVVGLEHLPERPHRVARRERAEGQGGVAADEGRVALDKWTAQLRALF